MHKCKLTIKKTVLYLSLSFALCLLLLTKALAASMTEEKAGSIFEYELNEDGTYIITGTKNEDITSVVIPEKIGGITVTGIKDMAFWNCVNLSEVTIPKTVTHISGRAFMSTKWLINKQKENPLVIINGILIDGSTATGKVTVSSSVKEISEMAFADGVLTAITIPGSVTVIGDAAFAGCKKITKISLPKGLKVISESLLTDCKNLKEVIIPDSVKIIGSRAFWGCNKLSKITIPSSVTSIEESAFTFCYSITKITIPSSVVRIGNYAFQYCKNLKEVVIEKGVTSIGSSAFSECFNLTKVTIPTSVKTIGGNAFSGKWLENQRKSNPLVVINGILIDGRMAKGSITIPKSVKVIAEDAFIANDKLKKVAISSGVTTMGAAAFANCKNLVSLTIPATVKKIGKNAFANCSEDLTITVESNKKIYNTITKAYKDIYKVILK